MLIIAARPLTVTPAAFPATKMTSSPDVPLTITLSAAASPNAPPSVPAKRRLTIDTSVPAKSLTTSVSVFPSALTLDPLDVVQIHDDASQIAGQSRPPSVRRQLE